ncbi:MAG: D-alanyl-D-alanine carboxypeptidase family [Candidatus Giovannonibacteria bacterium GW2011_GWA2_53_7]|uniref:D-alanyl-D-alanine carboxypeptidase family n=1 Tax=Candidatus Giovannonibacteria bacterium GW2011_GWA2_53_7 TaxID=1618650 RepID=A0A0G2AVY9_9BACT|nr:MAG: D-alanyl-D-alanine carboxypeptidase family [Candidatus Giovannonibacteria bacterium GW2011_GWA2_53_7]
MKKVSPNPQRLLAIIGGSALVFGLFAYGTYRYGELSRTLTQREVETAQREIEGAGVRRDLFATKQNLTRITDEKGKLTQTLEETKGTLTAEQNKNTQFAEQIRDITGTVGTLQKLAETDPELLKKYSKVYFLNENYIPARLSAIDPRYLYDVKKPQLIISEVLPRLHSMLIASENAGSKLEIVSAYRSFGEQVAVKSGYKVVYGSGANQFSADQGYSEHQLGTAIDLTAPDRTVFVKFNTSAAYAWLTANAYRFGFTLSYPNGNAYYQFEPWHWRFVGVKLAAYLRDNNKFFYDLDQREIDAYLISLFD